MRRHDPSEHSSRRGTERIVYERCRESGIPSDAARKIAEQSSTDTHRRQDRTHSDQYQPRKRRG